ncbi:spore coat protein D [Sporolactobacillus sp. THM7-7]|nr:spore coat protein D [Sporolactobacillus sp. THM7-7]
MFKPCGPNQPIYCDPQYVVHDSFVPRFVPVVHPVIHVNRQNVVNVPRHIFEPQFRNEVIDPGYPGRDFCKKRPCGWW